MRTVYDDLHLRVNDNFAIKVEQRSSGRFRVSYGKQVNDHLTYAQAAHRLGEAMFHRLACEGEIRTRD